MNFDQHTIDLLPMIQTLFQSMPIWGILAFILHRWLKRSDDNTKARAEELKEQFRLLNQKLDKIHEFNDLIERRLDAVDVVISVLMKDSFSSSMIARGTGGWPRTFQNPLKKDPQT